MHLGSRVALFCTDAKLSRLLNGGRRGFAGDAGRARRARSAGEKLKRCAAELVLYPVDPFSPGNDTHPNMGLCASSSAAGTPATAVGEDMAAADADYRKQLDKIDDAQDNNLLSMRTFPVRQALGHGYLVLPAEAAQDAPVTTLDGDFSRVTVRGQDQARMLRMRTFRRKHLLRGGVDSAARRVAPFVAGVKSMHRLRPCRFLLPLEHAFYNKNSCVLIVGPYDTSLNTLVARGLVLDEKAATSVAASIALALRHMHAATPPVLAGSNNLVAAHVLVNTQGHIYLSLLPTAATQVGVVETAQQQSREEDNEAAAAAAPPSESAAAGTTTSIASDSVKSNDMYSNPTTRESPGAKYRVQTKQSEIRSQDDPANIAEENRLKARDWLLLGRLMASLCGISGTTADADLIHTISSSTGLGAQLKQMLTGLLEPDDEKRWSYDKLRATLDGAEFPWSLFEDSKETSRPPAFSSKEVLGEHVAGVMADNAAATAKFAQDTLQAAEADVMTRPVDAEEKKVEPEVESKLEPAAVDSDDEYDLDSITSEDSLAMLDEDELLPWEVSEVLANWDYRSTVASLHQISNFTNSKTMASFAAYDAQFQGGNKQSKQNSNKFGADGKSLRADLSGIGRILEDDITRQEAAYNGVEN